MSERLLKMDLYEEIVSLAQGYPRQHVDSAGDDLHLRGWREADEHQRTRSLPALITCSGSMKGRWAASARLLAGTGRLPEGRPEQVHHRVHG